MSGNPGGVPHGIAELKRLHEPYGQEALEKLVEIMREGNHKMAFYAAKEILDRLLGRTRQEVSGPDGGAVPVNLDLLERLRSLVKRDG